MSPPRLAVEVEDVHRAVGRWLSGGDQLSALRFPEFAGADAPGSAVSDALRSMAEPAEQSCDDLGAQLSSLADAADNFLESITRLDSPAGQSHPGHR